MNTPKDQAFKQLQARFADLRAQIEVVESAPSLEALHVNLRSADSEFKDQGEYSLAMMASPGARFSFSQALTNPAFMYTVLWPVIEARILELAKGIEFGLPPKERAAKVAALKAEIRKVEIAEEAAAAALEDQGHVAVRRADVDMGLVLGEASEDQKRRAQPERKEKRRDAENHLTGDARSAVGAYLRHDR